MNLMSYSLFLFVAALINVLGHTNTAYMDQDPSMQRTGAFHENPSRAIGSHAEGIERTYSQKQTLVPRRTQVGGYLKQRPSLRVDYRTFGNEHRGRLWYQSYQKRFFAPDFIWPKTIVFMTFFSRLLPQLEMLDIPQDQYQAMVNEVKQLQLMLAEQSQDADLNQGHRRQIVDVLGKLVDLVPGIDIQGIFQRNR